MRRLRRDVTVAQTGALSPAATLQIASDILAAVGRVRRRVAAIEVRDRSLDSLETAPMERLPRPALSRRVTRERLLRGQ